MVPDVDVVSSTDQHELQRLRHTAGPNHKESKKIRRHVKNL
jgi:hypothetical protein